ncbi:peptide chain release factor 2 [Anaerococcus hydrogenalis]|uniref:Peptide chain release factor 2 n=1 Tax=Anaerococcus hydrogenalis TaxID=33029 RepID=A0A2N6UJV5_9FIRM|nr:peptide chain release factor 2 [Anaerococcus hydrogenalis]MDK7695048.1 peptide chain release factor 2 [Anaerococcus hydrogenalis]MDK7696977.1 peptide chain release factor 2 [Anaerococcus hydrogenalis]MDK7708075.1 peptide chain release factor 2 [Anaerococcus hydrogenalis]PMC81966.1 peptide chain release factor 2 [Anaerococcus hydrogenalis]
MAEIYELREIIKELDKNLKMIGAHLDPDNLFKEIKNIEKETLKENFWDDSQKAQEIMADLSDKKDDYKTFISLKEELKDQSDLIDIIEETNEELDSLVDVENSLNMLKKEISSFKIKTELDGEYDRNNVYMVIHAGAGGLEATDWAEMLMRMYTRFFERRNFKFDITDLNNEEAGGIKSATIHIKGSFAYGYLKGERGVHRLVRISPFDSSKRRHTSFASIDIFPELNDDMSVEIDPKDLRIDTYRASGAGGQHVNKTDSAVRITHIPTGVIASSQAERSQTQNKETAMKLLLAKLTQIKEEEHREKIEDIQGNYTQIAWGSQIRSYVFHPYTLVKDHRTNFEVGNVESVMDGDIDGFIDAYLANKGSE